MRILFHLFNQICSTLHAEHAFSKPSIDSNILVAQTAVSVENNLLVGSNPVSATSQISKVVVMADLTNDKDAGNIHDGSGRDNPPPAHTVAPLTIAKPGLRAMLAANFSGECAKACSFIFQKAQTTGWLDQMLI